MGYLTSWGFIIDFLILDAGVLIGWCLRVALTRAQKGVSDEFPVEVAEGVFIVGIERSQKSGAVARWE